MRILILGGTSFIGRYLAEEALARGHTLTLFNRGQRAPDLFPEAEHLRGDRGGDLGALRGRRWDAVIDPSAYLPRIVRASLSAIAGAIGHYTFISTASVYAPFDLAGKDEGSATGELTDEQEREADAVVVPPSGAIAPAYGDLYGPLKTRCEEVVSQALPGRDLIVRPGLVVGPHDYTDRFTYWPSRLARGGDVLAPGRPDRTIRAIDARDLAAWTMTMIESARSGVYNATGADGSTMASFLEACKAAGDADARLTWVDEAFLLENEVGPWVELPLWLPEESNGIFLVRNDRAIADGLTFRPLAETARDTLAWDRSRDPGEPRRAGLAPDRERALLQSWRARRSSAPPS